jgi:hypothetical protein
MVPVGLVGAWLTDLGIVGISSFAAAAAIDLVLNFDVGPLAETAMAERHRPNSGWLPPVDPELMAQYAPDHVSGEPVNGSRVRIFEDFNPLSAYLVTIHGRGDCLAPDIRDGTWCAFDTSLSVRTGDIAQLVCADDDSRDSLYRGAKRIERLSDGRMLAACNEGTFEVDLRRVRVCGRLVSTVELPEGITLMDIVALLPPEELAQARREHNARQRRIIADREARRAAIRRQHERMTGDIALPDSPYESPLA